MCIPPQLIYLVVGAIAPHCDSLQFLYFCCVQLPEDLSSFKLIVTNHQAPSYEMLENSTTAIDPGPKFIPTRLREFRL